MVELKISPELLQQARSWFVGVDEKLLRLRPDVLEWIRQEGCTYSLVMAKIRLEVRGDNVVRTHRAGQLSIRLDTLSFETRYWLEFDDPVDAMRFKLTWC